MSCHRLGLGGEHRAWEKVMTRTIKKWPPTVVAHNYYKDPPYIHIQTRSCSNLWLHAVSELLICDRLKHIVGWSIKKIILLFYILVKKISSLLEKFINSQGMTPLP
jgi:hypothetical protein